MSDASHDNLFDVAVIGGGLAGLSLAIQMADQGARAIVFEKQTYPFHKVCGEYVSMESWDFLKRLGLPLDTWELPRITRLNISSASGNTLSRELPLGGFGVSRHRLDHALAELARTRGVTVLESCRVDDVSYVEDYLTIETGLGTFRARVVAGAFGKRSNLDRKLKRQYQATVHAPEVNYVGVKYHVEADIPPDLIELHSFRDGYCGISRIEEGKSCMCYLTAAHNLREFRGNIRKMEENVLAQNPFLSEYFHKNRFLFPEPVTVSQVRIGSKPAVDNHIMMIGDAAGFVAPLSGNGMSMALRSAYLLSGPLQEFLDGRINRMQLEHQHATMWRRHFGMRIRFSRYLQRILGRECLTETAISALNLFPFAVKPMVRMTHGRPF
ncbi:Dehydrogenase (flavoprotein) [Catalinimonas alkaloidigena]|uniref:Dehydrogenase (Flavoprotein) n=1 Tax=Catalinimonas alkaloidigena TaxID=1075417 RepID=A0A1G9QKI8_9BACT|nr:NAD(P)/FAD-dependent oxidoreductase [Catalinimonas alkaloidigena]SDM11508.1 Dehydrogenase (flavoprotein) [Catalinimonas alkaloidigena]